MGSTIVYTTHYMEEVEQLCNRIIIIDKGEIIATGSKEELKQLIEIEEKVTVEIDNLDPKYLEEIENFKNVQDIAYDSKVLYLTYTKGKHSLSDLIDYLSERKIKYKKIYSELPTLNDVFLELTGKELRD